MQSHIYANEIATHMQKSLEALPIHSSSIARHMVKAHFPVPATAKDIEHYVHSLLTRDEEHLDD